jgi:8-oxo-dGTP pyrophosphatase MutT (NUDIX family)
MPSSEGAKVAIAVPFAETCDGVQLLVIRRSKASNNSGRWESPAGHVDPGENWQEAAVRELREETGIEKFWIDSKAIGFRLDDQSGTAAAFLFQIPHSDDGREPAPEIKLAPDEHDSHRWVLEKDLDKVPNTPPKFAERIRDLLKRNERAGNRLRCAPRQLRQASVLDHPNQTAVRQARFRLQWIVRCVVPTWGQFAKMHMTNAAVNAGSDFLVKGKPENGYSLTHAKYFSHKETGAVWCIGAFRGPNLLNPNLVGDALMQSIRASEWTRLLGVNYCDVTAIQWEKTPEGMVEKGIVYEDSWEDGGDDDDDREQPSVPPSDPAPEVRDREPSYSLSASLREGEPMRLTRMASVQDLPEDMEAVILVGDEVDLLLRGEFPRHVSGMVSRKGRGVFWLRPKDDSGQGDGEVRIPWRPEDLDVVRVRRRKGRKKFEYRWISKSDKTGKKPFAIMFDYGEPAPDEAVWSARGRSRLLSRTGDPRNPGPMRRIFPVPESMGVFRTVRQAIRDDGLDDVAQVVEGGGPNRAVVILLDPGAASRARSAITRLGIKASKVSRGRIVAFMPMQPALPAAMPGVGVPKPGQPKQVEVRYQDESLRQQQSGPVKRQVNPSTGEVTVTGPVKDVAAQMGTISGA